MQGVPLIMTFRDDLQNVFDLRSDNIFLSFFKVSGLPLFIDFERTIRTFEMLLVFRFYEA